MKRRLGLLLLAIALVANLLVVAVSLSRAESSERVQEQIHRVRQRLLNAQQVEPRGAPRPLGPRLELQPLAPWPSWLMHRRPLVVDPSHPLAPRRTRRVG